MCPTIPDAIERRRIVIATAAAAFMAAFGSLPAAAQTVGQPAPGTNWAQIVEAAKKEGTVTIYSGQGLDQLNDLAARFKKQYGITVQVVRAVDAELLPKVDTEFNTGRGIAGVFITADLGVAKDRHAKGYLVAPVGPSFNNPAYKKESRVPDGTFFEASAAILTFSWNKELWPKGLKDYPDVLDPALAGKIGIGATTTGAQVDFYTYLEETYGPDFTTKLSALKPRIYPGALPMGQAVVAGEVAVALTTQPLTDEAEKGAPVGWGLAPKPWGARFWGLILKTAPTPNAAQLLADFIITEQGQEAVARKAGAVLPNVKGTLGATDNVRQQDLSKLTPEYLAAYRDKWKKLFQNN
jgi:iron(III) transport system substrate-binding protein